MTNEGWIKLHRKLRETPYYTNSKAIHVWVECLMRATHQGKDFYLKRQKIKLKAGQFSMGRDEFGKSIGISGSTAWFWLLEFEVDSMVDIKKTPQGSIVTIKNWDKYQEVDSKVDKGKTTDEQQMNTNKNVKNDKKIISKDITTKVEYGNKNINMMLLALKKTIGIEAFVDSSMERNFAKHCLGLIEKIGKEEFKSRLSSLLEDDFHAKNCNKIKYVYNNIKGFKGSNISSNTAKV